MKTLMAVTTRLSQGMAILAGIVLIVMVALTFADVVLRYFGRPITGAYELVAFLGVAVTALALPRSSLLKAHVYVDLIIDKLHGKGYTVLRGYYENSRFPHTLYCHGVASLYGSEAC